MAFSLPRRLFLNCQYKFWKMNNLLCCKIKFAVHNVAYVADRSAFIDVEVLDPLIMRLPFLCRHFRLLFIGPGISRASLNESEA